MTIGASSAMDPSAAGGCAPLICSGVSLMLLFEWRSMSSDEIVSK